MSKVAHFWHIKNKKVLYIKDFTYNGGPLGTLVIRVIKWF